MNNNSPQQNIRAQTRMFYLWELLKSGISFISENKRLQIKLAVVCLMTVAIIRLSVWAYTTYFADMQTPVGDALSYSFLRWMNMTSLPIAAIVTLIVAAFYFGTPLKAFAVNRALRQAGLTNCAGETPLLIREIKDPNRPTASQLDFLSLGVSVEDVKDKQANIVAATGRFIADVQQGQSPKHLTMYAVRADSAFPKLIPWSTDYLDQLTREAFEVPLGLDIMRRVITLNFDEQAHGLASASSGGGKSELTKVIAAGCVYLGAEVVLLDRKRIDFTADFWVENCTIIRENFAERLREYVAEIERRLPILEESKSKNLSIHNRKMIETGQPRLTRIVIMCDELSQLIDKGGRSKAERAEIDDISASLCSIFRLGRAVGVHGFISGQRLSAENLPGDIRSCSDFRAVGRCDQTLSECILGNRDGHKLIDHKAQGRFLTNDGVLFQAFLFDDENCDFR